VVDYTAQFLTIAGLHLVAVASPGPDFAIVLRQSVAHGRAIGLWTSVGIGSGILVHTAYSLLGFALLVRSSPVAFTVMKLAAAAYLAWIGGKALRAKPNAPGDLPQASTAEAAKPGAWPAFRVGFVTNALNPKATFFFLSVFSVVIDPDTPRWLQAAYGVWMAVMTAVWFSIVAIFFTQERVRRAFLQMGHWFDRIMGVLLIALAVRLVFATAQ
jgi:RhtB (resistance to homoserine/threonine) family protein